MCGIALHSRLSSCIPPLRRHSTLDNPRLKTEEGRMKMLEDRRTRGSRQRMSGGAGSLVSHSLLKRVGAVFYLFDRHANFQHRMKAFREPTARLDDIDRSFLRDCVNSFAVYACSFITFTPSILPLAWPFFYYSGHFTLPFIPFHLSLYILQDIICVFGGYKGKCELVLVRLDSSRFLFHMWADLTVRHLPTFFAVRYRTDEYSICR